MSGTRDSSLLFSLKALERLETTRVEEERAAKVRAAADRERQRADAERRTREAEAQRIEEEALRRIEADRARREEEARLEAQKLSAIERVRAEVDARARAELARAQAARDVEIAKAHATASRGRYRFLLGISVAATVAIGAMAAVLTTRLNAATEEDTRRASALESARKDCRRTEEALMGARREIGDLRERLRAASSPSAAPDTPKATTEFGAKPTHQKPSKAGPVTPATCDQWDPMCGLSTKAK